MSDAREPRLKIIEEIDSGLYGKVYKGRQRDLDRIVAVKIIKPDWAGTADAIEHAKALGRVDDHPNIVTVHGVEHVSIDGVGTDLPAMVMEWIEGEVFGRRLDGPHFTEQEARRICAGVLDGIEHMHGCGIAHGDLHWGNIILHVDCTPKIIDIDANKDVSLARLSTISRDGAISEDLKYCSDVVYKTLRHANISLSLMETIDGDLRDAVSIADIRTIVARVLDEGVPYSSIVATRSSTPVETATSLVSKIQQFVEDDKPASLWSVTTRQVKWICQELVSDRFSCGEDVTQETVSKRIHEYETTIETLLPAIANGCFWGNDTHIRLWTECIESVANVYADEQPKSGMRVWLDLRQYPTLVLFYAAGIGAFLNDRFGTLRALLRSLEYNEHGIRGNLADELARWKAGNRDIWNQYVIGDDRRHTPISDRLEQITYQSMGGLVLLRNKFELRFDRFEYFVGLVLSYGDGNQDGSPEHTWGPIGSFLWRRDRSEDNPSEHFLREAELHGADWAPFKAGLFDGRLDRLQSAIKAYDEFLGRVRGELHIF